MDQLADAERERQAAADQLAAADTAHRAGRSSALRAAQGAVATEREARARIEARLEGARATRAGGGAPHPGDAGVRARGLPGARRAGARARRCRRSPTSTATCSASRPTASGSAASTCRPTRSSARSTSSSPSSICERLDVEGAIAKLRGAIGQLNREAQAAPQRPPSRPSTATSSACSARCSAAARRASK